MNGRTAITSTTWTIVLHAYASIGGVTRATSTEPLRLKVDEPWITAKLPRTRIELGKTGEFPIEFERKRDFDGTVRVELVRLPKGLEYEVPAIPGDDGPVVIALRANEETRTGRHRSIYARLTIETAAGTLTTTAGGGEVRVDKPLPPELRGDPEGGNR